MTLDMSSTITQLANEDDREHGGTLLITRSATNS
jgi:hypothetical protein